MEDYFNEMNDLDLSCLYEENDEYENYYCCNVSKIYVRFFFINNNELECKKKIFFYLKEENKISQEEINHLLKTHSSKKYKLKKILKYNLSLKENEVLKFIKLPNISFLKSIEHKEDIYFEPTIKMFHEVNEIILLLEKEEPHNTTKKVYLNKIKYLD
jgi:hypothetical protein